MTPEELRLLRLFGSAPLPSPKANEVPFPMGDPRMEEERQRLAREYQAGRAAQRKTFRDAPIEEQIKAIGNTAGFFGGAVLEGLAEPFAKLGGGTAEGSLTDYFAPKTPAQSAALGESAEALYPVAQAFEAAKIPDITPGMLTSPTRLFDDATRQVAMAAKQGVKTAGRAASSMEDMLRQRVSAPVGSVQLTQSQPTQNPLGFYSALDRATDSLQNKGTGQQFLNQITNMQGVKADEIKWTGLDEFLKGKKDVTKQEVKDYLNANQVKLEEVRLGEMSPEQAAALAQAKNRYREITDLVADTRQKVEEGVLSSQEGRAILEPLSAERSRLDNQILTGGATPTKFRSYSTRGGQNYRELLLTLPFEKTSPRFNDIVKQYAEEFKVPEELAREELTTYVVAPEETSRIPKYEKLLSESGVINQFESSHFDQPNILAHMRVSDFEQDGKKIMLVDEVQSDWHQEGRKRGYDTPEVKAAEQQKLDSITARREQLLEEQRRLEELELPYLSQGEDVPFEIGDQLTDVINRIQNLEEEQFRLASGLKKQIPDAPFKTTWHELALRRAVREASEKGFDKIAIPTGSVQNDRYKLSNFVNAIDYRKNDDGTYGLIALDDQGNSVITKNRLTESQLEDTIGKEMAKKIVNGVGESFEEGSTAAKEGYKKISGIDLEVGGEGMKGFYDQMVPKYLNKLGSKFGTKVTRGTIKDANGKDVPVHELTITPQMRKSVLEQGQPLFAAVPAVGLTQEEEGYASGGAIKKAGKAAKKASKATDLEAEYSQLKAALEQVREGGRTPVVPAPNRWFMNPEKFPGPQGMIERALANVNQERSAFGSGAYINPVTGEILDSAVMENLLVAIDPKTGRPMMSGRMTDLEELEKSLGSQTLSNLVRKGLFKHSGGDPILADLPFIATIEKGPHFYGLSTEYASPAMLFNTGKGDNPTLRPKSRGSLFAVGDEVGEVQLQGRPHPVYEKLMVAPVGSDVQGKLLKKAGGGAIKKAAKAAKAASKAKPTEDMLSKFIESSVVKTPEGKPLTVYRGQRRDAGATSTDLRSRATPSFTDNREVANIYSLTPQGQMGSDSFVMPAYLQMKSPIDFREYGNEPTYFSYLLGDSGIYGKASDEEVLNILNDLRKQQELTNFDYSYDIGYEDLDQIYYDYLSALREGDTNAMEEIIGNLRIDPFAAADSKLFVDTVKKYTDHDGMIVKDVLVPRLAEKAGTNQYDTYRPFYQTQIKSAIGNRGTYDTKDPDVTKAGGGAIRKAAKAAKAASKASEPKEQPIYWGMYRGYAGDDVSATEPQFAAMDKKVAEYYAKKRAAQTGLPPHLEMIYKQLEAGRKYGHTVPMDEHNRELLITQAYELQPEEIKGRYQLKKRGGLASLERK